MLSASHFLFYITLKTLYQIDISIISISQKETEDYRAYYKWNSEPFIDKAEIIVQVFTEVIAESSILLSPIVSYAQGLMSTPRGQGAHKSFTEH